MNELSTRALVRDMMKETKSSFWKYTLIKLLFNNNNY